MPDYLSINMVNDHFSYISRMIGNALTIRLDLVCLSEGHSGIDKDAVSTGFQIECKLGADISALVEEAREAVISCQLEEFPFTGKDHFAVKLKGMSVAAPSDMAMPVDVSLKNIFEFRFTHDSINL